MKIYKYLSNKNASSLCQSGVLRIGTIYEYRKEELFGKEIGDIDEGKKIKLWELSGKMYEKGDVPEVFFESGAIKMGEGVKIGGTGPVRLVESCPNYFIYSASLSFETSLFGSIDKEYDACVQIRDCDKFANAITKEIERPFLGWHGCVYGPKTTKDLTDRTNDHTIRKEIKYEYQKEIRAIWGPVSKETKGQLIKVSNVRIYCKKYGC
jgi:hypothetical protein